MNEDSEYLKRKLYAKEHYLEGAVESLERVGRYWNGSIARVMVKPLQEAIEEEGYEVFVREIPPIWEHVFYLVDNVEADYSNKLEEIALRRSVQLEQNISKPLLEE
ncbi:hypothetical protein KIH87_01780 [Paraneptunicella aestuarii]|uniref:hypothetical protein n=1 Tax=Paraneptunicella aestuarii TaxID=2831148 RepID=UPI001E5B7546|nr:hypothetical protein [Paraneptunicella aestuarii]UAA39122.1 hypothetical protein KIH87_01780 [Paraneptunicella aestuarii]